MVRPVSLKVGTGDFAVTTDHRRVAVNLVAGTLNSATAFSVAAGSSGASTWPSQTDLLATHIIAAIRQVICLPARSVRYRGRTRHEQAASVPNEIK